MAGTKSKLPVPACVASRKWRRNPYETNESFRNKQCDALFNILKKTKFTDVTLYIGSNRSIFQVNRILLAAHSAVFEAMFYGEMVESKSNAEIEIIDMDPAAFQSVLNYCYCNDPVLNESNIVTVRAISDKYLIRGLSELCDETFVSILSTDTICKLLNDSVNMRLDFYVRKCQQIIYRNFGSSADSMVQSVGFKQMNLSAMRVFLQSEYLDIKEEDLWKAVLNWTKYQTTKAKEIGIDNVDNAKKGEANNQDLDHINSDIIGPPKKKQKLDNESMATHDDNNGHSDLSENEHDDDIGLYLLKKICPLIRFGLMNAKYFVKNIKPLKCLTDKQLTQILSYYVSRDEGCGEFSVARRDSDW